MKEGYQLQVKYMNETTEEEIHEACKKVMREREKEMNLMGEMFIKDIQEVIREESQQVYSTLVEEEDVDGSSLQTMRKEMKKELDQIRGDEKGWMTFIPKRNKIIN